VRFSVWRNGRTLTKNTRGRGRGLTNSWKFRTEDKDPEVTYIRRCVSLEPKGVHEIICTDIEKGQYGEVEK
jgi:hypothetical protein